MRSTMSAFVYTVLTLTAPTSSGFLDFLKPNHCVDELDYSPDKNLMRVAVGNPPKLYYLELDFQSNATWIVNRDCPTELKCFGVKDYYDKSDSSTFTKLNSSSATQFRSHSFDTEMAAENLRYRTVKLCDIKSAKNLETLLKVEKVNAVVIPTLNHGINVPFGLLDRSHKFLSAFNYDGVFGLAPSEFKNTSVYALLQDYAGPVLLFESRSSRKVISNKKVILGTTRSKMCTNFWELIPTISKNAWDLESSKIRIGNEDLASRSLVIRVDPFAKCFSFKAEVFEKLIGRLNATTTNIDGNQTRVEMPCDVRSELPVLHFHFGNSVIHIRPDVYVDELRNSSTDSSYCILKFKMLSEEATHDALLGAELLEDHCLFFEYNRPQIAFAKAQTSKAIQIFRNQKHEGDLELDRVLISGVRQ